MIPNTDDRMIRLIVSFVKFYVSLCVWSNEKKAVIGWRPGFQPDGAVTTEPAHATYLGYVKKKLKNWNCRQLFFEWMTTCFFRI